MAGKLFVAEEPQIGPGRHAAWVCSSDEEIALFEAEFVRQALEGGARFAYVGTAADRDSFLARLAAAGQDVEDALYKGLLQTLTVSPDHVASDVPPELPAKLLTRAARRAAAEGYSGLYVLWEAGTLSGISGERMIQLDTAVGEAAEETGSAMVCRFDTRRVAPEVALIAIMLHEVVVLGDQVYRNLYEVPATDIATQGLEAAALNTWLWMLQAVNRTSRALARERDLLSRILDVAQALVIVLDTDGKIVQWNRACEELSGYSFKEVRGLRSWEFLIPPEDATAVRQAFRRLLGGERPVQYESRWITRDGDERIIAWTATALVGPDGPDGTVTHVVGTGIDITERRAAEERSDRLMAVLRAVNEVSRLTSRARDADELLATASRVLADVRDYECACIATFDEDGNYEDFVQAGPSSFRALQQYLASGKKPPCVAEALASAEAVIADPDSPQCRSCPLHGLVRGGPGVLARMEYEGRVWGVVMVWPSVRVTDLSDERMVLAQLASDLAFTLQALETRQQHEEAVREIERSKRSLDVLLSKLPGMVYRLDRGEDWRFEFVSDGCREITGYPPEEFLGKSPGRFAQLINPEDLPQAEQVVGEALDSKTAFMFRCRIRRADGGERWLWVQGTPVLDETGEIESVEGYIADITEHRLEERRRTHIAQVLRSIRRVNQIIFSSSDRYTLLRSVCDVLCEDGGYQGACVAMLSASGRPVEVMYAGRGASSEDFCRLLVDGTPPENYEIMRDAPELKVVVPAGEADRASVGLLPTEKTLAFFLRVLSYGDRPHAALMVALPADLALLDEEVVLFQEISDDIALALQTYEANQERERAAQALRASVESYQTIFNSSSDMILICDARRGTILDVNEATVRITGYSREELRQKTVSDFALEEAPYTREDAERHVQAALAGDRRTFEWCARNKSGELVWLEVTLSPVVLHGEQRLMVVARDISERRRLEESQRLAALGQLAAGVAHEINNILASMLGRAELAQHLGTKEAYDKLVDTVLREAQRGADVSRNLLRFARPPEPKQQAIMVEQPIESALDMAAQELENTGVKVEREYRAAGHTIMADASQLEQVFLNLIINACHAMPGGGTLTVATDLVLDEQGNRQVLVTVTDTGVGIPPENVRRIFDPFFTTKGRDEHGGPQGTGLGLAVCHRIIQRHGGTIHVRSKVGEGTTFELRFPAYEGPGAVAPEQRQALSISSDVGEGHRLLLVEDEDEVRESLATLLTQAGFAVTAVGNVAAAIEALREESFDVVVTDLLMHGGGGVAVVAATQELDPPIPTIVITGVSDETSVREAQEKGAALILPKPFRLSELIQRVRELLPEADEPEPSR
ncbi:MAG: PAS domain S-box protein [Armatimonadetes bacterium]|nr:PAS domain S-box protein [Armatimonadota bacterium]